MERYVDDFKKLKDSHEDCHNYEFNRTSGLSIQAPDSWPVLESVAKLIDKTQATLSYKNFVIIYSSLDTFRTLSSSIKGDDRRVRLDYIKWHEIYVAMKRVNEDVRFIQNIRDKISQANLVVFCGNNDSLMDVIDQVRADTSGCLIFINCQ
jgi:hypothetical protein